MFMTWQIFFFIYYISVWMKMPSMSVINSSTVSLHTCYEFMELAEYQNCSNFPWYVPYRDDMRRRCTSTSRNASSHQVSGGFSIELNGRAEFLFVPIRVECIGEIPSTRISCIQMKIRTEDIGSLIEMGKFS